MSRVLTHVFRGSTGKSGQAESGDRVDKRLVYGVPPGVHRGLVAGLWGGGGHYICEFGY